MTNRAATAMRWRQAWHNATPMTRPVTASSPTMRIRTGIRLLEWVIQKLPA